MKYKLEYWPYGEFETAEAAEHLNRRAAEGWELVNIAAQLVGGALGLALYCRNAKAKGYRYTADIMAFGDNEEYLVFCRDAGWEPLIKMDSGVQIFVSRDGSGRPLYTSPETEYDHQLQVFRYNHGDSASPIPYFVGIAVWAALLVWIVSHPVSSARNGLTGLVLGWTGIVVIGIIHCVNLVFIRLALRRAEQGKAVKRPGWMAKGFKLISIGVSLFFSF